jgi:alpha-galactosidase
MSAAPLMMGHDLRETDAATLAMLTNRRIIAIDQDARGVQGKAVRKQDALEIWAKPLADGRVALALFNRGTQSATMALTAADAGLSTIAQVEDQWSGATTAALPGSYDVPAHGAVMVVVKGR